MRTQKKLRSLAAVLLLLFGIAIWQFYRFVTFEGADGRIDSQGGLGHLWFALAAAVLACVAGFFVFSAFVNHDRGDELHITSAPPPMAEAKVQIK